MVSIIIPIYNMARYIGDVLDCLLAQTYQDFEILCIDNGSTDQTPSLLNAYLERDKRIKVLSIGPSNAGAARNVGYKVSKGEYLLFLDADDVFSPYLVEELVKGLETTGAEISVCQYIPFYEGDALPTLSNRFCSPIQHINPAQTINLFNRWVGWAWDKMFTREFIEKYQLTFQEIPSSNDLAFTYSSLSLATKIYEIKSPLIAHRYHPGSIETKRYKTPFCCIDALREYYARMERLKQFEKCPRLLQHFKRYVAQFIFWNLYTIMDKDAYQTLKRALPQLAKEFRVKYSFFWLYYKMKCFIKRPIRQIVRRKLWNKIKASE